MTKNTYTLHIPLKLVSEANTREHWTKKHTRKKKQQQMVYQAWHNLDVNLPINISFTRIAPRRYDSDNLVTSFKHVRDIICSLITPGLAPGRADDLDGISFEYHQHRGEKKEYKIIITIKEV